MGIISKPDFMSFVLDVRTKTMYKIFINKEISSYVEI
jgi:hypothetical protein